MLKGAAKRGYQREYMRHRRCERKPAPLPIDLEDLSARVQQGEPVTGDEIEQGIALCRRLRDSPDSDDETWWLAGQVMPELEEVARRQRVGAS